MSTDTWYMLVRLTGWLVQGGGASEAVDGGGGAR